MLIKDSKDPSGSFLLCEEKIKSGQNAYIFEHEKRIEYEQCTVFKTNEFA